MHGENGLQQALAATDVRGYHLKLPHELWSSAMRLHRTTYAPSTVACPCFDAAWPRGATCSPQLASRKPPTKLTKTKLQALKPGADTQLNAAALEAIAEEAPSAELPRAQVVGASVVDVAVAAGLQPSKGSARRLIKVTWTLICCIQR